MSEFVVEVQFIVEANTPEQAAVFVGAALDGIDVGWEMLDDCVKENK